jgi:hypothetical protein
VASAERLEAARCVGLVLRVVERDAHAVGVA